MLAGGAGDDVLSGFEGHDTLIGGAGADVLLGFAGTDIAAYSDAGSGLRVALWNWSLNTGDAVGDFYFSIEGLAGSPFNDTLRSARLDKVL